MSAGRRLANSSNLERICKRPCSGRMARSILSHLGPPTAPSKIASAARALARALSVRGTPWASMELPPIRSSSKLRSRLNFLSVASSILRASVTISGPMPSPGSIRICLVAISVVFRPVQVCVSCLLCGVVLGELPKLLRGQRIKQPGCFLSAPGFVRFDGIALLQGQTDIIQSFKQTMFAEVIDLEGKHLPVRCCHSLSRQIHGQLVAFIGVHLLEQGFHLFL